MNLRRLPALFALFALAPLLSLAADLAGTWKTEFDSQIGIQKYTFEFTSEGDALTGQAAFENSLGNGKVALKAIKVDGEKVTFVEEFNFEGQMIPITYTGTLTDDTMTLHRQVGEFGSEDIVAHRQG